MRLHKLSVRHVIETYAVKFCHMVIVQSVINLPPIFTTPHQSHLTQSAQLMRNGRLSHYELRRDFADVHLSFKQNGNDTQARGVAECAEQVSQVGRRLFFE